MPWSTTREDKIRQYCTPVKDDTTNWPALRLQNYWNDAHIELKSQLCPPFDTAEFELLNGEDTNSSSGNVLIARKAALLIYIDLGNFDAEEQLARERLLATKIEQLQSGEAVLFDADGTELTRDALVYHSRSGIAKQFTTTDCDSSGNILTTGTLDQRGY